MMGPAGREEQQLAGAGVVKRRDHGNVGQVGAAAVGIVGNKDVARSDDGVLGENLPDGLAHRTEMDRDVRGVHDQVAAGREQGTTEVQPLLDVDAGGRVPQRYAHLLGDADEVVVEDLQHHGVGVGGFLTQSVRSTLRSTFRHIGQEQVAAGKDFALPAGIDDRGRGRLAEDGGTAKRVAGPNRVADKNPGGMRLGVEPRLDGLHRAQPARDAAGHEGASWQPARAMASTRAATISNARPSCA